MECMLVVLLGLLALAGGTLAVLSSLHAIGKSYGACKYSFSGYAVMPSGGEGGRGGAGAE